MDFNPAGLHQLWESVFMKMESEPSQNGGMTQDSLRQRGRVKEDKYCGVCGDRALGYNFDAISCESCKAFFRRNAPKSLEYFKCPYDENCKMDVSNRRFCKRCRLKKCFDIGMRKEYILTDEEKSRKRQKIEENRRMKDDKGSDGVGNDDNSSNCSMEITVPDRIVPLTFEESIMIDEIVTQYKTSLDVGTGNHAAEAAAINDLVNVCEVSIRRVIDMAKKLRSFKMLPQTAQISLLKGGSIELLIIRSVLTFDSTRNQFLDACDNPQTSAMSIDQFKAAATRGDRLAGSGVTGGIDPMLQFSLVEDVMKFIKVLGMDLKADETMLIFLLLISLYSPDRPNLEPEFKKIIAAEQEKYSSLLRRYVESKMPLSKSRIYYAKLLMKLTDIRNLNEESSQVFLNMNSETIQPLMKEVLDIQQPGSAMGGDQSKSAPVVTAKS